MKLVGGIRVYYVESKIAILKLLGYKVYATFYRDSGSQSVYIYAQHKSRKATGFTLTKIDHGRFDHAETTRIAYAVDEYQIVYHINTAGTLEYVSHEWRSLSKHKSKEVIEYGGNHGEQQGKARKSI
jgi:hypothetical protein